MTIKEKILTIMEKVLMRSFIKRNIKTLLEIDFSHFKQENEKRNLMLFHHHK